MKKLATQFAAAFVAILAAVASDAQTISWNDSNVNTVPVTGTAGVVAVTNWNNSNPGNNGTASALMDNTGAATAVGFTITGTYGGWRISGTAVAVDGDGTYNRALLNGYANTSSGVSGGVENFAITGIPYTSYKIIAYISSDTAGRTGNVRIGTVTNFFTTLGSSAISGASAVLTQTTDTTGAVNPSANYAIFTNLSGSSQTLTLNIPNGGGMAGFQIVNTGAANLLSLAADTTASPSTNVYVGSTVTFAASFTGTQPMTNQWKVDTGSGFVSILGATNSTLTLTNVQLTNAGNYALFASNAAGASNSTPVTLNVFNFPTNSLGINVQFTGSWLGSGNAPTQTGSAVIGNVGDVWNTVSNPTGGTSPAGLARGTNIALFDATNVYSPITMDYVGDYVFNGTAFGYSNPFRDIASPYANLMSGYMGSVTTSGPDTNTITLRHLIPGVYDIYLYVCGRSDGQTRVDVISANDQTATCGPNNGNYTLISGVNYVHLTPNVTTNGVLTISYYGTADAGQGLLNGFQLNGPDTNVSLTLASDTVSDSPLNDYVGRRVSFSAAFAGFPTPSLQWEVDKGSGYVPVLNATNSILVLSNLQTTDSGNYALFATNAAGGLNSTPLTLNVQTLPSPFSINVQFDGTTYTGTHATPQVGGAVIGGGADYWNPVSNPNPVGPDTNPISGFGLLLSDANSYGTPLTLDYTGNQDYNNAGNTPFNGSGSPAANLMQASLVTLHTNAGTVTVHGIPTGVYDLYLYSCAGNSAQDTVTRFGANDSYDTAGPNAGNNILTVETNYVHLTPTVATNGVLNISFVGPITGQGNLNGIQLYGPGATTTAPTANFYASPTNIYATQTLTFVDRSSGNITNWFWNFGDGNTLSTNSGVVTAHSYTSPGTYTVSLAVNGIAGSSTNTQVGYVIVNPMPVIGSVTASGGALVLGGNGGIAGNQYRILASTNVTLSLSNWVPVWTNTFATDGSYGYTNSTPTNSASFYRLVTP